MATFEITANGETYEIEAPDEQTALKALQSFKGGEEWVAQNPKQQQPKPPVRVPFGPQVAWADQAIEQIPIVGPSIKSGLEDVRANIGSWLGMGTPEDVKARVAGFSKAAVESEPLAATVGQVTGQVAPLAALTATPIGATLLGTSGGPLAQSIMGGLSTAGIMGADTLARGGSAKDATTDAMIGAGIGSAFPVVGGVVGKGLSALMGRGVPREAANLGRALKDDGIRPQDVNVRLKEMGDDAMLMDLGPNLQRQAGALATVPGEAQKVIRSAVTERGRRAGPRVANDVASTLGTGPELGQMADQIIIGQKQAADPLYTAVRPQPIQPTSNLQFVFQTPMGKEALKDAVNIARNDGFDPSTGWTVGLIDYAKQALDDIARAAKRTGQNNRARQATQLADVLKREADLQVPQYAEARAAFAGPAQVLDAVEAGQAVFTKEMTPMQLQSTLNQMSQSERDAFLQASRSAVEASMGNAVNDVRTLRDMFRKGYNEAKLRILLGDDVADDLLKRIDRELAFGNTTNVVSGNSETAARQVAQQEVAPEMRPAMRPEGVVGLVFRAFDAARAGIRGKVQPRVNQRMAAALKSGYGQMDPVLLEQISRAMLPKTSGGIPPAAGAGLLLNGPR